MASSLMDLGAMLKQATVSVMPPNAEKEFAAFARRCLADTLASGQVAPMYDRYVNGQLGRSEEQVKLPGKIIYIFHSWKPAIELAIEELRRRIPTGPARNGHYRDSFIVAVGGHRVTDFQSIPIDAEVLIFNPEPYTRKLQTRPGTGFRHFDSARRILNTQFKGLFSAELQFLNISGGIDQRVPYILKGGTPLVAAKQNNHSSAFRLGLSHLRRRKDREAGAALSYPTLVIKAV